MIDALQEQPMLPLQTIFVPIPVENFCPDRSRHFTNSGVSFSSLEKVAQWQKKENCRQYDFTHASIRS